MLKKYLGTFIFVVAVCSPGMTSAHQEGVSFDQVVGEYRVDIGYNPPSPQIGAPFVFDFDLFQSSATSSIPVDFDSVWVQVKQNNIALYTTRVDKVPSEDATLSYVSQVSGEITVYVRYERNNQTLVETIVPISIIDEHADSARILLFALTGGTGLFVGVVVGLSISPRRREKIIRIFKKSPPSPLY